MQYKLLDMVLHINEVNVMIPDDVYVRKTVAGDAEAFDELIKRHRPKIYGDIRK